MKIDLTGRVALVTGSTRGIGRAIAASLVGGGARGFSCDVADTSAVTRLISDVEAAFGSLDILVNNAGLTRDNVVMRLKDDDWDAVIDANLRGPFAAIRAASRGMMKRRWGRIINISSVVGLIANKGQANYAASKAV